MELKENKTQKTFKRDFFKCLRTQGYTPKQVGSIRFGLKYALTYMPLQDLVTEILNHLFVRGLGQNLREKHGDHTAQKALTSVRYLRKYLIFTGNLNNVLLLSTITYFSEVEDKLHIHLTSEREYSADYVKRIAHEYACFSEYLISITKHSFVNVDQIDVFNYLAIRKHSTSSAVSMRVLLRFLYREGYVSKNYCPLVLCAKSKANEVKKFLPSQDIEKLLTSIDRTTVKGKRDYTFFLLMARLSLRGAENLRLKLDDIDWYESSIRIQGKHDKEAMVPFTMEVGEALIDYLKHSPRVNSEHIFVSTIAPISAITCTQRFSNSLEKLYRKAGIKCPTNRTEINVFRHSFATSRLNEGNSILDVCDMMRHDSITTTMIYAKYDLPSLSNLACEWPGAVS